MSQRCTFPGCQNWAFEAGLCRSHPNPSRVAADAAAAPNPVATFLTKEKETNIGPVIFEKSALPQTNPIRSSERPTVAPPPEAGLVNEADR